MTTPNKCPYCGKPHAFSIIGAADLVHYPNPEDFGQGYLEDADTFHVYVCPKSDTGFIVVEGEAAE